MDFDRALKCSDCCLFETPNCTRIEYNESHQHCGRFWFRKPVSGTCQGGCICSDFTLRDFYKNSPSYKDFTLEDYMIYHGKRRRYSHMAISDEQAIETFLQGDVSICVDDSGCWYKMRYKDFFYGNTIKDGKVNVHKKYYYKIRKNLPYKLCCEDCGGI